MADGTYGTGLDLRILLATSKRITPRLAYHHRNRSLVDLFGG